MPTDGERDLAKRQKTAYVCNECGADYSKWAGQCSACGTWNSLTEVRLGPEHRDSRAANFSDAHSGYAGAAGAGRVQKLSEIDLGELPRIPTGAGELDRVLGGGLVPGSVVLIGGHPGARQIHHTAADPVPPVQRYARPLCDR